MPYLAYSLTFLPSYFVISLNIAQLFSDIYMSIQLCVVRLWRKKEMGQQMDVRPALYSEALPMGP